MIARWRQPVAGDLPSGPNLEYDSRYQSLLAAAAGRTEQQLGANILPAEDPDWHRLVSESTRLLDESRDIRLLVIWTYGSLRESGLDGLAGCLQSIAELIESHWNSIHPQVEADGDWYMRSNAVSGLADADGTLRLLRDLVAATVGGIPVTVRDVCALADGQRPDGCPSATLEQLRAASRSDPAACEARYRACRAAETAIDSINNAFATRLGPEALPALAPLRRIVTTLKELYAPPVADNGVARSDDADGSGDTGSQAPLREVRCRSDALQALAFARDYFERSEPSNPAALLIRRAERLASSSFLDIIEDMAPASLEHIKMQAGLNR